jgi:hypothetical protein
MQKKVPGTQLSTQQHAREKRKYNNMRFPTLLCGFLLAVARQGICQNQTFDELAKVYHESSLLRAQNNPYRLDDQPACTEENIRVRRSWFVPYLS